MSTTTVLNRVTEFIKDHSDGVGLAALFVGICIVVLFLVYGIPDPLDEREEQIRDHFNSLSPSEQYDWCLYHGTTPSWEIVENAARDGWTREEVMQVAIPVSDELCGFDFER